MTAPISRAIGWDPGPKTSAWAVVSKNMARVALAKPFHFVAAGLAPSSRDALIRVITGGAIASADVVGVETPEGYIHEHVRGAQVLETRGVATELRVRSEERGFKVVAVPCATIRRAFCGAPPQRGGSHGDAAVSAAVARLVSGLPKRTSNHVRDAILCAVFAVSNPGLAT